MSYYKTWMDRSEDASNRQEYMEYINRYYALEKASIQTIEEGIITGDLNSLLDREDKTVVNTEDFLKAIAAKL